MKKFLCITVIFLLLGGLLSACSSQVNTNEKNLSQNDGDQSIIADENFDSIKQISDTIDEMIEYLHKGAETVKEESSVIDKMILSDVTAPIGNAIFNCRPMEEELWEVEDAKMLTGFDGVYSGSLKKEGNVYKYHCLNKYDEGYTENVNIDYNTQKNTVDYTFESDQEGFIGKQHMQFYIDENNKLFIVGSEYSTEHEWIHRYILYYDGKNLNYGMDYEVKLDTPELPVSIIDSPPTSWENLKADKEYHSTFIFDGNGTKYIKSDD